jgi:hypothetical protein
MTVEPFGARQYICCIAGCRVQFPNDMAYGSANYDHYSALFGFFPLAFAFISLRVGMKKLKPVI